MVTAHDVPRDMLIKRLAEHLKKVPQIAPPEWVAYVKTGSHAERLSQERDWWFIRCASLLRKLYFYGPLGLGDFRSIYGGRTRVGYAPAHHRDAGGSTIRKALQQLEAAGLVGKEKAKGRMLTPRGSSLLDKLSNEIFKELVKSNQALSRYS